MLHINNSGFSGLLSRASNILPDARLMGYEFYQCLDYPLSLGSKADCPDRYLSRFNEMIESCRIIRLILYPRSYEELRVAISLVYFVLHYSLIGLMLCQLVIGT